jgi:hypothetical protein
VTFALLAALLVAADVVAADVAADDADANANATTGAPSPAPALIVDDAADAASAAQLAPWSIPRAGDDDGIFASAQLFVGGDATVAGSAPDTVVPAFRLDRAEVGGGGRLGALGGLLRFETIRSAAPQSAFGIDGNSLLPRLKLAYGVARPTFTLAAVDVVLEARAGLVPEPWLETLERRLGARGLLPLPSERAGLLGPADLGASVAVAVADVVDIRVAVTNGEGNNEVELNAAKNVAGVIACTPLAFDVGGPLALGAQIGGRFGSVGIAGVDDHRAHAALFAGHPRAHVVVEGSLGLGQDALAALRPVAVGTVVDVVIVPAWLGITARLDHRTGDLAVVDGWRHDGLLAVFSDLGLDNDGVVRRTRLWLAVEGSLVGAGAGPVAGVPAAAETLRGLVSLEVTGLTDVFDPRRWPSGR